jgi:hypothetical protein
MYLQRRRTRHKDRSMDIFYNISRGQQENILQKDESILDNIKNERLKAKRGTPKSVYTTIKRG